MERSSEMFLINTLDCIALITRLDYLITFSGYFYAEFRFCFIKMEPIPCAKRWRVV